MPKTCYWMVSATGTGFTKYSSKVSEHPQICTYSIYRYVRTSCCHLGGNYCAMAQYDVVVIPKGRRSY